MPTPTPAAADVSRAIDIYLKQAYPHDLPLLVRAQVEKLRSAGEGVFNCPVFVRDQHSPPTRYALRLGNEFYPHMKLIVELAATNDRFLFRADTHDRHVCPTQRSPEYQHFVELMGKNQKLAESIEMAWEQVGIPTFRAYLREDLKRRLSAGQS